MAQNDVLISFTNKTFVGKKIVLRYSFIGVQMTVQYDVCRTIRFVIVGSFSVAIDPLSPIIGHRVSVMQ